MSEQSNMQAEISETTRLEAFSDGVFAIAITLLVLEIRLPHIESQEAGHLASELLALWPTYLAYIISFITIGIMWINHHAIFKMIHRTDRTLMFLNALLLMVITFLNFPTVILAEYLQLPDGNTAAVLYSGTLFVIALLYNALWGYVAFNQHLLDVALPQSNARALSRQYFFGPAAYLIATIAGIFSVGVSVAICLGLAVFFALPSRRVVAVD